ncbi:hypothetical protein C8R46DRAFT_999382 [Mycena filopes]|nr:hypothetical protein C8R46DRAFT_999382 [Mycena filopes]
MLDLPQELIDRIIDELHDDWHSLAACGLVCWEWVPASRFHLFSEITLQRTAQLRCLMHQQFRPFLDMVATGSTTFAPFISHLTLQELDATPTAGEQFRSAFAILSKLSAITSLEFKHWRALGSQPIHNLLPQLTGLSKLILDHVDIDSVGQLFGMLEMCPALTSLTLIRVSASWAPGESSPISYSHSGSIRTLRLIDIAIPEFLDAFTRRRSQLNCKSVDIRGIMPEDSASVGKFLECVAGRLKCLRVGFHDDFYAQEELPSVHFVLRNTTQLTTFQLDDICPAVPRSTPYSSTILSAVKCALVSPGLTNLVLSLSLHSDSVDLERLNWKELDMLLSSAPGGSLRMVEFRVRGILPHSHQFFHEVEKFVVNSVPRCWVRFTVTCVRD